MFSDVYVDYNFLSDVIYGYFEGFAKALVGVFDGLDSFGFEGTIFSLVFIGVLFLAVFAPFD